MKTKPILPAVLLALSLSVTGCQKTIRIEETQSLPSESQTGNESEEQETAAPETVASDEEVTNKGVTIKTWALHKYEKYSDSGALIYRWNSREPEVIIENQPDTQYRINRSIRENDQDYQRYDFINDSENTFQSSPVTNSDQDRASVFTFDYQVLHNDGTLLSLKQERMETKNGISDTRTDLRSYEIESGKTITLSTLSDNPDALKEALAQAIAGQAASGGSNDALKTQLQSCDLNNFALLKEGIESYPELKDGKSGTIEAKSYFIPYGSVEQELNAYGKKLMETIQKSDDEPEEKTDDPDYIFPESSTSYLTGADLLEADASVLRLARNEIYARHGRKFDAPDLEEYFGKKPWYHGTIDSADFKEDTFSEIEKTNLSLIKTAEEQLPSKELNDSGVNLEMDRDYYLDLDGDGTCETVRWNPINDTNDWLNTTMELIVNGQVQTCVPKEAMGSIKLTALDLQKEDREIELHLDVSQDSDSLSTFSFYRYQNGKLELIGDLAGKVCSGFGTLYRENGLRAEGDGVLAVTTDTPFQGSLQFGCYYVDLLFSYKDGRFNEILQDVYEKKDYEPVTAAFLHDNPQNFYMVSNSFPVTVSRDDDTPAFPVTPGEIVCPIAWAVNDSGSYVLVMNEDGSCGWVKEESWDTDRDTAYYVAVPAWG